MSLARKFSETLRSCFSTFQLFNFSTRVSVAMIATAAALSASAKTIEFLTNGELDSPEWGVIKEWSTDSGSWNSCQTGGKGYIKAHSPNDLCTLSQTVTLADFGISVNNVPPANLIVTASVTARCSGKGGEVSNAKVYQLDATGAVLSTHEVMNRPDEAFDETDDSLSITLNADASKLKYELNAKYYEDDEEFLAGPLFRLCSLKISWSSITFVSEGATIGTAIAQQGNAFPAAPEVTREDYGFIGYFTEATGGTEVYNADRTPVQSSWDSTEDATYYAHWEPVYAVTFVSEGVTVGVGDYSESGTAKAPVAQRAGDYTFLGYFTENGTQVFDASGTLVPGALSGLTPKATLRAQWQRPAGSVARLVYRGQLTKLGKDEPAVSEDKYEKKMHFRVYDGESAETPLWEAKDQPVTVNKDGSFVAAFGDDTLAELIATGSVTHVGVAIGDSKIELTPRRALRPVAAVNRALVAEAASKDIRIGNLLTENALAANNVSVSQLEVYGAVTAPGAGPVEVSPVVVGDKETLTLLRGDGVKVFSNGRTDLGEVANVLRGQKLKEAPADGIALVSSSKLGSRGLRIPGVIQYCRKGDWVRAPASEPDGVKVTFFPFIGKEGK